MKPTTENRYVNSADDAPLVVLSELEERFGAPFVTSGSEAIYDTNSNGIRNLSFDFAPESDPSKVFNATIHYQLDGGLVDRPTNCDWSQYLFRDRLLGPFRESLSESAAAAGLAGWALTMTYARYDDRVWLDSDFDEYVGTGHSGDPVARVFLILPPDAGATECAKAIEASGEPLYKLDRNTEVIASRAGFSPFSSSSYFSDIKYIYANSRDSTPTCAEIEEHFQAGEDYSDASPWDGTSNGGSPEFNSHLPQVTWCPGYGPEA